MLRTTSVDSRAEGLTSESGSFDAGPSIAPVRRLEVGAVDDPLEREAVDVARLVSRVQHSEAGRAFASGEGNTRIRRSPQMPPGSEADSMPSTGGDDTRIRRSARAGRPVAPHDRSISAAPALSQIRVTSDGAVVRRKLDDKYKSANVKAAGHKGSRGSTFTKLLSSLDEYHQKPSEAEQYEALTVVKTRATAFLNSSTRNNKRKGSAQTKEAARVQFVQTLQADVQQEMDALDAAPTDQLLGLHKATSPDSVVMLVAKNLATQMNTDVATLLGLSANQLKERFITEAYLPQYMAERAGNKPPGMSIAEQIETIRSVNRVDLTTLTPNSDAATLFQLFESAAIGKYVNTLSDPKFGTGEAEFVPTVPGWDASNAMKIKGSDTYRAKVIGLITEIAQTPVGKELLRGIGGASNATGQVANAVHAANKKVVAEVKPPSLANVNYQDSTGQYMYANSAGGQTATVDAFNDIIGADPAKAQVEKFRRRDAVIGLFHELVHVYLSKVTREYVSLEDPEEKMTPGQMYEPRVAGIRVQEDRGNGKVTFPFDDPTYEYVTENTFRKEYARLKGETDYYVRPYYLQSDPSEVTGPTDKQKVN